MTKISVVIPTYNSWSTLKDCIASIQKQTLKPYETIIIDNGSSDGTSNKVRLMFPGVKLITLEENTGVTGGRNKGIEHASSKTDFILFFDHDMIADKKMLEELMRVSKTDKNIGIVTPKIYYFGDKKRIWAAGTGINLLTGQVLFRGGIDTGQYDFSEEVPVAPAVLLVKKNVLNILKMFDDRYFATFEDTDFCFRAKKAGFKVFYEHSAVAFHKIPYNKKEESERLLSRAYFVGRNRILFMKDFGSNFYIFLLIFLPVYVLYYLRLAISHGRFSDWLKLIQGIISGLIIAVFSKKIIFSGERPSLSDIQGQHLAKYKFALKFCRGKKILEIGCGSGYGSKYLVENGVRKITAYDIDPRAINFAVKNCYHKNISFAEGDAQNLKHNNTYEAVISFEVIEHLERPEKLIQLGKKSLTKNGIFILSTPNREYSTYDGDRPSNPYHVREFYPQELKKILLKYFDNVQLYGVVLSNKDMIKKEESMHESLRWKFANFLTNKRIIRSILNFLPEYPKRMLSGEGKLSFHTEDFEVLKSQEEKSSDFVAVCN